MNRKEMVKVLGQHFGVKPKYMGVPSCNYQIETETETYIIDRAGKITDSEGKEIEFEALLKGTIEEEINEPVAEGHNRLRNISSDGWTHRKYIEKPSQYDIQQADIDKESFGNSRGYNKRGI